MRCSYCTPLTIGALRPGEYAHRPSLRSLQQSASSGCDLCTMFYTALQASVTPEAFDSNLSGRLYRHPSSTNTAIRLSLQLHDTKPTLLGRSNESRIWILSGQADASQGEFGTQVYAAVGVFATEGTPPAQTLAAREVCRDPNDERCYERIRGWLHACNEHHAACRPSRAPGRPMPTRVVDVGSSDEPSDPILLATTPGQQDAYIALSYCWGPAGQAVKTTPATLALHTSHGIPLASLSRTIRDAVHITRKLGIRYLWIDALCIIQDEPGLADFRAESVLMAAYYNNAHLTISAGSAADSRDGFLNARAGPSIAPVPLEYSRVVPPDTWSGPPLGHVYARLPLKANGISPIDTRAWTLQEGILSRRILQYRECQISFRCLCSEVFEEGTMSTGSTGSSETNLVFAQSIDAISLDAANNRAGQSERMLRRWYEILAQLARRDMGNPYDKLPAVAGIAARVQEIVCGKYMFGLWSTDLHRGLLWRTNFYKTADVRPLKRYEDRAPSWSWASVDGPIRISHEERYGARYTDVRNRCVEVLDHSSVPGALIPVVNVNNGQDAYRLQLRGSLKRCTCVERRLVRRWQGTFSMHSAEQQDEEKGEVGIAYLDDVVPRCSDGSTTLLALRIVREEGLILTRMTSGTYRRKGTFTVGKFDWFEKAVEYQEVVLI